MDDFMARALIGGIGVAAVSGPLGAFVVWRRMAYFGDTLAHAALLGVALGLVLGIDTNVGVTAVCATIAVTLVALQRSPYLGGDTLLGILSHGALALGLVTVALFTNTRIDLMAYLFGDILAVSGKDILWVYSGGGAVLGVLVLVWRPLLAATVHPDVAIVEGVPVTAIRLIFMLLLAVIVALAMKIVGILLVTALLIIPAASARTVARTPEQMALLAAAAGAVSVAVGLWASFASDAPSGPSIVVAALVLFLLSTLASAFTQRH